MEEKVDGKTVMGDARVRRWTQKLLDLSLRNRLLNVRDGKQFIPLFCRDVCTLEDRLAESETVQLEQGDPEDVFLASTLTVEETRKRLTALYRQAKTDLEEGGVNTLFLAVGFLKWRPRRMTCDAVDLTRRHWSSPSISKGRTRFDAISCSGLSLREADGMRLSAVRTRCSCSTAQRLQP